MSRQLTYSNLFLGYVKVEIDVTRKVLRLSTLYGIRKGFNTPCVISEWSLYKYLILVSCNWLTSDKVKIIYVCKLSRHKLWLMSLFKIWMKELILFPKRGEQSLNKKKTEDFFSSDKLRLRNRDNFIKWFTRKHPSKHCYETLLLTKRLSIIRFCWDHTCFQFQLT